MAVLKIKGGKKLSGEVNVQGSKNAILPMLAACILCKDFVRIRHCPKISDVYAMIHLLETLGCDVTWEDDAVVVDARTIQSAKLVEQQARVMRSSIILAGAMLGREGKIEISYPGGCSIGTRPINLHLKAFRKMNVQITETEENMICTTSRLTGEDIELDFPSVGATENVILAAVLADGMTTLRNAAREPEIVELCKFLRKMGASITGEGSERIVIKGVTSLHGADYQVMCDRIVLGTYIAAIAGAGGEADIKVNCVSQLGEVCKVYEQMGVTIEKTDSGLYVQSPGKLNKVDLIRTRPYPGFPTDMQSQTMAVLTKAQGTSIIIENLFEGRYKTVSELRKMGASITVEGRAAIIKGVKALTGANVEAKDLRGGAALIIAGCMAEGCTTIADIQYIERGYENIVDCYKKLNVNITLA
ncbi:UDP-N-acetylglucosamine 1-carboxyvinyltransferase [[Clostridium] polysaccharolyticum]|uniref:UDP-N-acetylglucosamine 1-carboxyvinyltransferase n=1 Tax=[Clostridium] polysaccharolyticum TaxID=29364 RepID=A0A1H9Y1A0_9FIRM|nr:UDP-N-acetylglucosamine 1-carboxyvinyltransferase [[Clostridium] polysaccharolyticum]SES62458.1 UDP-N-acetylglucosamine 1-carboxyvinyltransferase [[Clostridium] polysaccharolyticum]